MNQQYKKMMCFLIVLVISGGNSRVFSANNEFPSPSQMPLDAGLMYIFAKDHPTLLEVEQEFGLNPPVALKSPTVTDPLGWLVYHHQGLVLELAANVGEPDEETLETLRREDIVYAGFFKIRTPEEVAADDGHSTYCVPTYGEIIPNPYADFLNTYDLRMPISIKGLEHVLKLSDPINIENPSPFDGVLWKFFYQTPDNCIIRLYGRALCCEEDVREESARERRGEFLFTGYWVVGCQKPESKKDTIFDQLKERLF